MKELLDQQSPKNNKMYKFTKNNPKFYSKSFFKKINKLTSTQE